MTKDKKKVPRVFISYSHDSTQHEEWVKNLSSMLVENGIDVILDQWALELGDDLAKFMEHSISEVDKELELAFEAGADVACVVAAAGLNEIRGAVAVARELHRRVMVDLIAMCDYLGEDMTISLAKEIEDTGADYICYHVPIDDQVSGRDLPQKSVRKMA